MEYSLILSFIGASVILSLMPGPDNIFVLTESVTKGQRNGLAIALGLNSGVLIHTIAAATGLSILIQKSAIAFSAIKYLGALYLFYLAYKAFKEKEGNLGIETSHEANETSFLKLVRKGFFMNVLNPKVSLFFIAFLPQFISQSDFNITLQMIILGGIFMLQSLLIFCMIAMLSGRLHKYLSGSKFWKITKWSKVSVLSILGLSLALAKK